MNNVELLITNLGITNLRITNYQLPITNVESFKPIIYCHCESFVLKGARPPAAGSNLVFVTAAVKLY